MEPSRYGHPPGWENNSALEGYAAVYEPKHRASGSYDERRYHDDRYSRDAYGPRNAFNRDILERENYPPPPPADPWSQSRKRSYEDEYSLGRESRRNERQYMDVYHENDTFNHDYDSYQEADKLRDGYHSIDNYRDHGFDRSARFVGRHSDDYQYDDYDYRTRSYHQTREDSYERDYECGRYSYDSDHDRGGGRDERWRKREFRDREWDKRGPSRERDESPRRRHERSRSRGHDDHQRSRSPRARSHGRSQREDSYDDDRYDKSGKRRDREEKRQRGSFTVAPSATVVVKGLSQNTTEEDLYQILAEWGPLRHVRVIKERSSGVSRGFAFLDFPSMEAARAMMDKIGDDGLLVDGRKLLFEYSSKPTWGTGGPFTQESAGKSGHFSHRGITMPSDWMCIICGCVNFARRTSCFQCNEARTDDAPAAEFALSSQTSSGKKGLDAGPTHVLVVRGLDENADEEMLRYEFSKHAPIKDLRLVRDKFTHVSRGFAFVHFHSVEDATKALEATNGTTLEKNGQILRVAYAKSILGPGAGALGSSQSSSLAAAAIEAAAFAQQYNSVGWAPKEYNPDEKRSTSGHDQPGAEVTAGKEASAPQSGFVWDEASGYYFDAASGFYYDGNTGLYYDGNNGIWYSYDYQNQQYIPCTDKNDNKVPENSKTSEGSNTKKAVISAPAATIASSEKPASLHDAVQAAATAALAAEKKEKEKAKEIKLASKSSILANKKKMNNVLSMWKQRSHEGQAARVALDDSQTSNSTDDRLLSAGQLAKGKLKSDVVSSAVSSTSIVSQSVESPTKPRPVSNSSGGTLMGVIRGSRLGGVKSDVSQFGSSSGINTTVSSSAVGSTINDISGALTPFRTDASALGAYATPVTSGSGKRRFSETPMPSTGALKEQNQTQYRDRAAERRSLYGSLSSANLHDGFGDAIQERELAVRKSSLDAMPFPPGVGGVRGVGDAECAQNYEVITADKAIDESNVGNRMLRNMGWHEGLGLGKDGSGMVAPVRAQGIESRAGLGSQQQKVDPDLEVQAGDSYKAAIHKKALARFREMSEAS